MQISSFPSNIVEEAVFSSSYVFGTFVKDQVGIALWIHIWVFYSVPLVFMFGVVLVPCCI
jgi:hypothetical protein